MFGICLGHQLLALALGAQTFKLKYGHRGGNQPVRTARSGQVIITAQNHGYAVDPATLPADVEQTLVNLNDGTNEGLRHRALPIESVQFHPEASPVRSMHAISSPISSRRSASISETAGRTQRPDPRPSLVIGSGPIVIGQAAEFDYAGVRRAVRCAKKAAASCSSIRIPRRS